MRARALQGGSVPVLVIPRFQALRQQQRITSNGRISPKRFEQVLSLGSARVDFELSPLRVTLRDYRKRSEKPVSQ